MRVYRRVLNSINFIICLLVLATGTVFTAVIAINVFMRYVLGGSLLVAEELSRYLLIWFGFMGMALGVHEGAHAGFDLIKSRLPHRTQRVFAMLSILVIMTYAILMLWGSLQLFSIRLGQMASTMPISVAWPFLAVPASFGLIVLRLGYSIVCFITCKDEDLMSVASLVSFEGD